MPHHQPEAPSVQLEARRLAAELRHIRHEILDCVASLSETRVYGRTDRDGWTLKHELAYLAASDRVLLALISELSQSDASPAMTAPDPPTLRRLHGQEMHAAQELRLDPLREHLAQTGEALATALEDRGNHLHRPAALGGPPAPAIDHVNAHLARAAEGLNRLRATLQ